MAICGRDLSKLEHLQEFKAYQVDVTNREELIDAINDFSEGSLDILIANAGIGVGDKFKKPNFEAARQVIDVNLNGVLYAFEAGYQIMEKLGRGQLVAVASVAGLVGLPGAASYSASKAGVLKLCEAYHLDFKHVGIDVTAIAPGFIDTPLTQKNKHSMPFLMSGQKGARKIKKAIDCKKALYVFPWQMKLIMTILDKVPRALYRFVMRSKAANYSS